MIRRLICRAKGHMASTDRCECCGKPVTCTRCGAADDSMDDSTYRTFVETAGVTYDDKGILHTR